MSKFGKVQKCRMLNPKTAHKQAQARLQARGISESTTGNTVLESRVDYRGKANAGMTVIRNDRTMPDKLRLNGWTYQNKRRSYGAKTVNYSKTTMFAPIGAGL